MNPYSDLRSLDEMEFTLLYTGPLPAVHGAKTRVDEKQEIRRHFHRQLSKLWETHPFLRDYKDLAGEGELTSNKYLVPKTPGGAMPLMFLYFPCGGFRFLPLVTNSFGLVASVEVNFLRQGRPGDLVSDGGDIDNRIKTLLDALRMPQNKAEVAKDTPAHQDELFFTVLEDDSLITGLSIETHQLLAPILPTAKDTDVWLKIHVVVSATHPTTLNLALM